MKKRLLGVLLASCMVLSSVTAFADEVVDAQNQTEVIEQSEEAVEELTYAAEPLGLHEEDGWLMETIENADGTTTTYTVPSMYREDYTIEDAKRFAAEIPSNAEGDISESSDELLGAGDVFTAGSEKEAINFLKKRGANRDKACEIILNYKVKTLPTSKSLVVAAFSQDNASSARDGDYILAHMISCTYKRDDKNMHYYFEFKWAASAEQEQKLDEKLKPILAELNLKSRSEYDKIKVIHDFIVNNVAYRKENNDVCHSAYSALCNGYASSQGYASLFFRMCMESGVQTRYITSRSKGISWNIVRCNNYWYNVDTCADDPSELTCYTYNYFMKCNSEVDRPRDDEYNTAAFNKKYPMAPESIDITKQPVSNVNFAYTFTSVLDDTKYSSTASEGRGKLLIFVSINDDVSKNLISEISKTDWVTTNDVYVIDITQGNKNDVNTFRYTTDPRGYIKFFYDETNSLLSSAWAYYSYGVKTNVNNLSYPVVAVVDKYNRLYPSVNGTEATLSNIEKAAVWRIAWPFNDVPINVGNWKFDAIKYVYDNKLMSGVSKEVFSADTTITRGMVATVLYRMEGSPDVNFKQTFADVKPGHYFSEAVCWAVNEGIASGYNADLFGVNDPVTREQLAKLLYSYAKYKGVDVSASGSVAGFVDWNQIHTWAADPVKWAIGNGIITGVKLNGYSYVQPQNTATRGECAAMLSRFHQKFINK